MTTHFAVLDLAFTHIETTLTITVISDIACHLYCRLTKNPPQFHPKTRLVRGIELPVAQRICFTAYIDNEQTDPGDTYVHHFVIYNCPAGVTRWFYFWGTINGIKSPSTSGIFRFETPPPPVPLTATLSCTFILEVLISISVTPTPLIAYISPPFSATATIYCTFSLYVLPSIVTTPNPLIAYISKIEVL